MVTMARCDAMNRHARRIWMAFVCVSLFTRSLHHQVMSEVASVML